MQPHAEHTTFGGKRREAKIAEALPSFQPIARKSRSLLVKAKHCRAFGAPGAGRSVRKPALLGATALGDPALRDELLATGLAPSTVRNTINPLQANYRHAVRRDVVTVNPTREVELPAERRRRDRIATAAEAARLIAALPACDRPIWATAFYAGWRRGELQALRISDVSIALGELSVRRSWDHVEGPIEPKSRAGLRTVPIIGVLHVFLADLAASPLGDALIFGRLPDAPFDPKTINDRAKRSWIAANEAEQEAAEREGRDPELVRPITLHECRHRFASLLIDAGVNPKAIQKIPTWRTRPRRA